MTVPEAQERLEALTVYLASCANSPIQRGAIEKKMARYYRIIQRARRRAHQSLASVATVLLEISENAALNEQKATAIIAAADLIRCASTEQLARISHRRIIDWVESGRGKSVERPSFLCHNYVIETGYGRGKDGLSHDRV